MLGIISTVTGPVTVRTARDVYPVNAFVISTIITDGTHVYTFDATQPPTVHSVPETFDEIAIMVSVNAWDGIKRIPTASYVNLCVLGTQTVTLTQFVTLENACAIADTEEIVMEIAKATLAVEVATVITVYKTSILTVRGIGAYVTGDTLWTLQHRCVGELERHPGCGPGSSFSYP